MEAKPPVAPPPPPPMPQVGMPGPETQSATQFMIAVTPAEILVTIGKSRVLFNPQNGSASVAPEWVSTFSLGPIAAKQLLSGLKTAVEGWEKEAGMVFKVVEPTTIGFKDAAKKKGAKK